MNRIPYTYLIGWSKLNLWYYGVKYAKGCDPKQLWKTYFTSSKYVKQTHSEHGDPDVIEIRKIFNDSDSARNWENKVLRRLKVVYNEKWLNKTDNKSVAVELCSHTKTLGMKHSEEAKNKMKLAWKNRKPISQETKDKLRAAGFKRVMSEESKLKISIANINRPPDTEQTRLLKSMVQRGKKASAETKAKMSQSHLNKRLK